MTWNGRIYVNEPSLSPEQYKMFFDRCEYGITLSVANKILEWNAEGDFDEVVPADELHQEARDMIKEQIVDSRCTDGEIEYEGKTLHWKWEPKFTDDDGAEMSFEDVDGWLLERILHDMLDNECHWGMY